MPRIAKALETLRSQINAKYPNRSKLSDGWIGDSKHASRPSDHNPNAVGVVTALDITHDLDHGVDTWTMAETLRQNRDSRIKYVISNGRIFSSTTSPWQWRPYTGSNKHAHHVHVSVLGNAKFYDDSTPWRLAVGVVPEAPKTPLPKGVTEAMRNRMMRIIMSYEGKIPPKVFIAPDGNPEIAGITRVDHPREYAKLKGLLEQKRDKELIEEVIRYYNEYTDPAQNWTDQAGYEFFLRDCILNRGPTGAAEILQMAVTPNNVDLEVGPSTRAALAALPFETGIMKLRDARERYEDKKYGKANRQAKGQWEGLLNRWNKARDQARVFQKEQHSSAIENTTTGTIVVGTGVAAEAARQNGADWSTMLAIGIFGLAAACLAWHFIRKWRNK